MLAAARRLACQPERRGGTGHPRGGPVRGGGRPRAGTSGGQDQSSARCRPKTDAPATVAGLNTSRLMRIESHPCRARILRPPRCRRRRLARSCPPQRRRRYPLGYRGCRRPPVCRAPAPRSRATPGPRRMPPAGPCRAAAAPRPRRCAAPPPPPPAWLPVGRRRAGPLGAGAGGRVVGQVAPPPGASGPPRAARLPQEFPQEGAADARARAPAGARARAQRPSAAVAARGAAGRGAAGRGGRAGALGPRPARPGCRAPRRPRPSAPGRGPHQTRCCASLASLHRNVE
jgi:hypothetical protein